MQGQERALFGSESELTLDNVLYEDPGNMPYRQQESWAMALTKDEVCFVEETARRWCCWKGVTKKAMDRMAPGVWQEFVL